MRARPIRIVAFVLSVMFLVAACGGDGGGGGSGASSDLEKWIPEEVNGQKLERKEVTVPKEGEEGATTTAPPEGEDAKNTSQLGQSLASSIPKVEGIAVGEIPSTGENAAFGQEMPALFVGALQSSEGVDAVQKSLGQSAAGATQETVKVDGVDVTVITFDMAQQLQGQQLPEGTPPLPTITIQFFSPEKDVVVVVFSTESREMADAATKASIESGK
ncbi:MAG: hypothetical protein IT198_12725 [Acidimicrobiia bacterium]|nr:hypothetical protein [Acidimicrobiia bacterium]